MARSIKLIVDQKIRLTAGSSWILATSNYVDAYDAENVYLWLTFESLSGGGTLTAKLQAGVYPSRASDAWVDLATTAISTAGDIVQLVTAAAANPITGSLRLKIDCSVATTTFVLRGELLLKGQTGFRLVEWLPPTPISVASGSDLIMPADQWANCAAFVDATLLVEFELASGTAANLTTFLETAPSLASETGAFVTVNSSALTDGSTQIAGRQSSTNPPMGVLRLRHSSSSGTVAGTMRVMLLLKDNN